jgi:hypothetical protein
LNSLDVLAAAAYDLSFQHALEHFGNEALTLHLVLDVRVVAETGLYQVFKEEQQELLGVCLLSDFELVRNLVEQNDNDEWEHGLSAKAVLLQNGIDDVGLQHTETAELVLAKGCLHELVSRYQALQLFLAANCLRDSLSSCRGGSLSLFLS